MERDMGNLLAGSTQGWVGPDGARWAWHSLAGSPVGHIWDTAAGSYSFSNMWHQAMKPHILNSDPLAHPA